MLNIKEQQAKAQLFHKLHHNGQMLVLTNIWDPLGAALMEDLGYPAVATASASMAYSNGYDDGENIPFSDLIYQLTKIAGKVSVPVTADIESGYAANDAKLEKNIQQVINAGIVGINIEDSDNRNNSIFDVETQCRKIALIKQVAKEMEVPLFINARTDVYIRKGEWVTDEDKLAETLKRGHAYINAGADCFFPLLIKNQEDIRNLVSSLNCPVNILAVPGTPDLKTLSDIGVARVSHGASFLRIAMQAMKDAALKLKAYEGTNELISDPITADYLKKLVDSK